MWATFCFIGVGYFFVVLGKLFAYSLGYFCNPTSKVIGSFYCGLLFCCPRETVCVLPGILLQSHIESYSPHLLPYKLEAEGVVYLQLFLITEGTLLLQLQAYKAASGGSKITESTLLLQLQTYKAASRGSNFRCGIAKVSQGVRKQFSWNNKKVAHNRYLFIYF